MNVPVIGNSENGSVSKIDQAQVCRIAITFPVVTDEQALIAKRNIEAAIGGIAEAQVMFTIMGVPARQTKP